MSADKADTGGRRVAVLALVAAGGASLGANVAETLSKPHADLGAGVTALIPPVLGFLGVELLTRVKWPDTTGAKATKWIGVVLVSVANAMVSFWHVYGWLAHHCHYDPVTAVAQAFGIDGLLLMSAGALLFTSPAFEAARAARNVTAGVASELAPVQPFSADEHVDGLNVHVNTRPVHPDTEGVQVGSGGEQVEELVFTAPPRPGAETLQAVRAVAERHPGASPRQIAEKIGVSRTTAWRHLKSLELAPA